MADATAQIPADVLAAALSELEGVALDPSTPDGRLESAKIAERLMSDEGSSKRLLAALEKHSASAMPREASKAAYGPAVMVQTSLPREAANEEPPIGSAEFEAFLSNPPDLTNLAHRDIKPANVMPLAAPTELGFQEELAEPLSPATRQFDAVFLDAQRQLAKLGSGGRRSLWKRIQAVFDKPSEWRISSRVLAKNYVVVEVKHGQSKIQWSSIASGSFLYVSIETDGKVTLKQKLTLADRVRTQQQVTAAFGSKAEAGAHTLLELRRTMLAAEKTPSKLATSI